VERTKEEHNGRDVKDFEVTRITATRECAVAQSKKHQRNKCCREPPAIEEDRAEMTNGGWRDDVAHCDTQRGSLGCISAAMS